MAQSSGATFASPTDVVASMSPGFSTASKNDKDAPIFTTIDTNQIWGFDPTNLVFLGRVRASVVAFFASKGTGKTTTLMAIVLFFLLRIGFKGLPYKIAADNNRMNADQSEWDAICRYRKVEPLKLKERGFNSLDPLFNFTLEQYIKIVHTMLVAQRKYELNSRFSEVLGVAMTYMYKENRSEMRWELLPFILRRLTHADFSELREANTAKLKALQSVGKGRFANRMPSPDNRDMLQEAHDLAGIIDTFLLSEIGQTFGGEKSFVWYMEQQLFVRDYLGLSEDAILAAHMLFAIVNMHGVINDDPRLRADMVINDENYTHWRFKPYAVLMYDWNKQVRGKGTIIIYSTHRPGDYETVGRETVELATGMMRDIDIVFIGHQDSVTAKELAERYNLSPDDQEFIENSGRGEWLVIIGGEPPVRVKTFMTADGFLRMLTDHDKASKQLATR